MHILSSQRDRGRGPGFGWTEARPVFAEAGAQEGATRPRSVGAESHHQRRSGTAASVKGRLEAEGVRPRAEVGAAVTAGLRASRTCVCGWQVPKPRYVNDRFPTDARRRHWKRCSECLDEPPARMTQTYVVDMPALCSQTFNQVLQRKLELIQASGCKWAHDAYLLKVGEPNPITKVKRVIKCRKCGNPAGLLKTVCPASEAGSNARVHKPPKEARVEFMSKLHKRACKLQARHTKQARKARMAERDEAAVRTAHCSKKALKHLVRRRKGRDRNRTL